MLTEPVPHLSLQEIVDLGYAGIKAQGAFATKADGGCVYLNAKGHACIIGHCLTPDEARAMDLGSEVDTSIEGLPDEVIPDRLLAHDREVLAMLQGCHDSVSSDANWALFEERITNFCERHNLRRPTC